MLLLAFFPFIFIIFSLFFLKQSVVKTSVYGLLVTCAIEVFRFNRLGHLASSVAGPESSAPDVLRNILRLSLFILFLLTVELFFFY
ncbi:hypothetical protein TS65_31370 [Aneurinibacillus migulanus]|uniref:Uncharacterized protein n=1 Tax=Aneurinibacillus migulanus TaxID=47500 RepID=A0A0D1VU56_ANEMI|nr:hypothetical protein TS65_31370 [Aneurinibacillus migulanus]KON97184.1 hypothetical protein AF333_18670 [Aneurinibacillus migulanus]SDK19899.1 hypothetical protein SAMN04487909_14311 [Aneurinibacillus migulanus]